MTSLTVSNQLSDKYYNFLMINGFLRIVVDYGKLNFNTVNSHFLLLDSADECVYSLYVKTAIFSTLKEYSKQRQSELKKRDFFRSYYWICYSIIMKFRLKNTPELFKQPITPIFSFGIKINTPLLWSLFNFFNAVKENVPHVRQASRIRNTVEKTLKLKKPVFIADKIYCLLHLTCYARFKFSEITETAI